MATAPWLTHELHVLAAGLRQLVGGAALTAAHALVEAGIDPVGALLPALTEALVAGPHSSSANGAGAG